MKMVVINEYKPRREGNYPRFVSNENGCEHVAQNPDSDRIRQFKLDGEVFTAADATQRCDYLVLNDTKCTSYFIELKGSDIPKAIEQVESSIGMVSLPTDQYKIYPRIVYRTGTHKINDRRVLIWKKRYGQNAVIRCKKIEEKI